MKYNVIATDGQGTTNFLAECSEKEYAVLIAKSLSWNATFKFTDMFSKFANKGKPIKAHLEVITDPDDGYELIWSSEEGDKDE